jgi:hypothetical protein
MNAIRAGINLFFDFKPWRLLTTDVTLEESNESACGGADYEPFKEIQTPLTS